LSAGTCSIFNGARREIGCSGLLSRREARKRTLTCCSVVSKLAKTIGKTIAKTGESPSGRAGIHGEGRNVTTDLRSFIKSADFAWASGLTVDHD
jgi:hypothetical protein